MLCVLVFHHVSLLHSIPLGNYTTSYYPFHSFFFGHIMWLVGSQFPNHGSNAGPWRWKHRVLTIGPPGNFLSIPLLMSMLVAFKCWLFWTVLLWKVLCLLVNYIHISVVRIHKSRYMTRSLGTFMFRLRPAKQLTQMAFAFYYNFNLRGIWRN